MDDDPFRAWVWVGISAIDTVCACSPPRSPSVWPDPTWMGTRPRKSGSAKLTRPSPPKVVPSRLKSAWFWLIGSSWPLHKAQPFGANTKLMILISDRNGSAIDFSSWLGCQVEVETVLSGKERPLEEN